MNRRGFFSALAAVAATAAFDPERALWKPGKLISIPKPLPVATPAFFELGDIITFEGLYNKRSGELQKFIVMAAGKSFSDVEFRFADYGNALVRPLGPLPEPPRFHREAFSFLYPSTSKA